MAIIVTVRPRSRVEIALPWRGGKSANYNLLKEICGERTRPRFEPSRGTFSVSRDHAVRLLEGLVNEFGSVTLRQYGNARTMCVEACWGAAPESALTCECNCAGSNHGSGVPLPVLVNQNLSVENEQTLVVYRLDASGRSRL